MNESNNNIKFLKRYHLWLVIILVILTGIADYSSNQMTPVINKQTVITLSETKTIEYYSYSWTYHVIRFLVNAGYTLSISLFISVFILKKIEDEENRLFQDRILKLQEGINKNLFDEIFKKLVDPEIFDLIKTDIINRESIRKNAKWIYDIKEGEKGLLITQTISYELFNQTRKKIQESMTLNFMPDNDAEIKIVGFKCSNGSSTIHDMKDEDQFSEKSDKEYNFPIEPDSHVNISLIIENTYQKFTILDNHNSKYPLLGLDIELNYPTNYEIDVTPSFSSPLKVRTDHNGKRVYEKVRAILPGQGITYKIRKNIA